MSTPKYHASAAGAIVRLSEPCDVSPNLVGEIFVVQKVVNRHDGVIYLVLRGWLSSLVAAVPVFAVEWLFPPDDGEGS